jgi:hypothetical protein
MINPGNIFLQPHAVADAFEVSPKTEVFRSQADQAG